jgi:hypothetical protein
LADVAEGSEEVCRYGLDLLISVGTAQAALAADLLQLKGGLLVIATTYQENSASIGHGGFVWQPMSAFHPLRTLGGADILPE